MLVRSLYRTVSCSPYHWIARGLRWVEIAVSITFSSRLSRVISTNRWTSGSLASSTRPALSAPRTNEPRCAAMPMPNAIDLPHVSNSPSVISSLTDRYIPSCEPSLRSLSKRICPPLPDVRAACDEARYEIELELGRIGVVGLAAWEWRVDHPPLVSDELLVA